MNKLHPIIKVALIVILFISVFIGIFAIVNYVITKNNGTAWLDGGSWVSLIVGATSAGATLTLGYVAFWQNKKQRDDNLHSQRLLELKEQENNKRLEDKLKFESLINYQHKYLEKLENIHARLIDTHFLNEILEIANACTYFQQDARSKEKFTAIIQDADRLISKLVILINYIQNTVTYNRYYIEEVNDLAVSLVRFRIALETLSNNYFGIICAHKIEDYTVKKIKQFESDITKLMNLASDTLINWEKYYQSFYFNLEALECNNNLDSLLELYHENAKKTDSLRDTLNEVQDVIKKEYEDNE